MANTAIRFQVTAYRRGRKPIVATFETQDAAEAAATAWGRYWRVVVKAL